MNDSEVFRLFENPPANELYRTCTLCSERVICIHDRFITSLRAHLRNHHKEQYEAGSAKKTESADKNQASTGLHEGALLQPSDLPSFSEVAGLDSIKEVLRNLVEPLKLLNHCQGLTYYLTLLYGAPGVGKIMLAEALGKEYNLTVIKLSYGTINHKDIHGIAKNIGYHFETAQSLGPSVLIIEHLDEILDTIVKRDRPAVIVKFIEELNKIRSAGYQAKMTFVIATCRQPTEISPDILSVFKRQIYVSLPDKSAVIKILELYFKGVQAEKKIFETNGICVILTAYTGSEIRRICSNAMHIRKRELLKNKVYAEQSKTDGGACLAKVLLEDLEAAQCMIKPSVTETVKKEYRLYTPN